jgi:bacillithiol biosynthesis cysteine-adding enzyme BshC
MERHTVNYADTKRFAPIVEDYLAEAPWLRPLYRFRPDRAGILQAIQERTFPAEQRAALVEVLHRQYKDLPIGEAVRTNLDLLAKPGTCTVTTGHQLCMFTGPLYVPFKILNVLRIAQELSTPVHPVVPVFWMATEDHDLAEVDHAWVNGHRIHWKTAAGGAVGRMRLDGIARVLHEMEAALAPAGLQPELRAALHDAYAPGRTLAEATRRFVDHLFGPHGLVIIDGDDPALKQAFIPIARRELLESVVAKHVHKADEILAPRYGVQVHARDLNLFHLGEGRRARIERVGEGFRVLDGGPLFERSGMLAALEERPEDISPNVLLRPLYQEAVLPNVAYVGGGGELAYWLQLRHLFDAFGTPMPAVVLRTSAGFLPAKQARQWHALGLELADLFLQPDAIHARLARSFSGVRTDLSAERAELLRVHAGIATHLASVDPTLERAARAREQRALAGLDALETKLLRAAKRRASEKLRQADRVIATFLPVGLQERRDNILPLLNDRGMAVLDELRTLLDPFDTRFSVLVD